MLRITKAEEQALRLTMRLAAEDSQLTLHEMANLERLPEPTVAKLLGQLRRGGVVTALRGRNGGYLLASSAEQISTADVLRALGGEPAPQHHCITDPNSASDCPRLSDCGLRSVWRHLQNQVTHLLEGISLADLLTAEHSVNERLEQLWAPPSGLDDDISDPQQAIKDSTQQGAELR